MGGCWSSSINIAAQIENLKDLEQHKPVARRSYKLSTHPCNSDAPGASNAEYKFYVDTNNERILKRKLRVIRKLGEGGVGCVYLTEDSTVIRCNESPLLYALKVIAASEKTALIRESVELIRDLERECKYIAEIMEDYFLEEENTIYIVLRYYEHGSLATHKSKQPRQEYFSQKCIEKVIHDLFHPLGLMHLHNPPILHRDISPCNLLVKHVNEDGTFGIVLNDFDVAREIDQIDERVGKVAFVAPEIGQNGFSHKEDSSKYTVVGKTNYMAPELKKQKYTTAVDIWSAGVVLYELMTLSKATGLQKMESTTEQQIHQNMRRHLQMLEVYESTLIDLVLTMLSYDPNQRPTALKVYKMYEVRASEMFNYGCKTENIEMVTSAINKLGYVSLYRACASGNMQIVETVMDHGANDYFNGVCGACKGGSIKIMELMLEKANTLNIYDWGRVMYGACYGGHKEIVFMLEKRGVNSWNKGMRGACHGGNIALVNRMIKKGANEWQMGLNCACMGGFVDIAQMMIQKGARNVNKGLWYGCKYGHLDVIQYMIEKGATDWNTGLRGACYGGFTDIVEMMIQRGADNMNYGLLGACEGQQHDLIDYMIKLGANDYNLGLQGACFSGNRAIVDKMIKKKANDWEAGLRFACGYDKIDIIKLMISKGAKLSSSSVNPRFTLNCYRYTKWSTTILPQLLLSNEDN